MAESDFPFIVSSGPKLQSDPSVRKLIRKQAMKDVGISRRKRGNYGRANARQSQAFGTEFPIGRGVAEVGSSDNSQDSCGTSDAETSESSRTSEGTEYEEIVSRGSALARRCWPLMVDRADDAFSFTTISLLSDYGSARSKFHLDITDLSILTNFNVGKSTIPILSANPTRLADLLGHPQWSYLQFVPGRYGSSNCITAAANCLMAKVHSILAPHEQDRCKRITMQLYSKALQALQNAISNEDGCLAADVLCATQLLSLHELLDPSRDSAWSHHIDGSAKLVKHRTRDRFTTDFDKALFAAHVGPIVSECLLGLTPCYLEEREWTELYRSITEESDYLTDRSPLAISVRLLMFSVPGLWYDVNEAVTGPLLFDDETLVSLEARCRKLHTDFIDWIEDYKEHCVKHSLTTPPPEELATRRDIYGAGLECLAVLKRLLATVCEKERLKLECEAQATAQLLLDLQKQTSSRHSWLFAGHEAGLAYTIVLTKDQWEENPIYESLQDSRLASQRRYSIWNNTLRMPS